MWINFLTLKGYFSSLFKAADENCKNRSETYNSAYSKNTVKTPAHLVLDVYSNEMKCFSLFLLLVQSVILAAR